jgi:Spy/CpxP family protein refolding chaperone
MTARFLRAWLGFGVGLAVWTVTAAPAVAAPAVAAPGVAAPEVAAPEVTAPLALSSQGLRHPAGADLAADRPVGHLDADVETDVLADEESGDCLADPGDGQKDRKHKWWSSDEGKAEFGLSDAQSRDLEAIFQQMLPAMRTSKADVDRYQQQLTKLLTEASAKEGVVVQAIDQLESAQSTLSRTRTIMLYRMYRLLSPDQRAKVQAYYERRAKEPDSQSVRR